MKSSVHDLSFFIDVTPEPIADDEATTQESEIEATTPPAEDDAQPVPEGSQTSII